MSKDALAIGSDTRPPVLFRGDYSQWRDRFMDFIERHDLGEDMIKSIDEGPLELFIDIPANPNANPPMPARRDPKPTSQYTPEERDRAKADRVARSYILQGLTNEIYNSIDSHKTAKSMWDEIKKQMQGTNIGARIKVTNCLTQYEGFKAKEGEMLEQTNTR